MVSKAIEPASFEDFLRAPARLVERQGKHSDDSSSDALASAVKPPSVRAKKRSTASSQKVKVGLTIDEDLVDAADDYIYLARKKGRRPKKNDVYEAALRQFLKAEGIDVR